jgi:hypothetical protein
MRTRIFRILAGLLAVLIVWFLTMADHSGRSVRELVGFGIVAVTFALFAPDMAALKSLGLTLEQSRRFRSRRFSDGQWAVE